ncbi:MAG: hypothetical protein AAFP84_02845, partial [Actinomycetota bacterium]
SLAVGGWRRLGAPLVAGVVALGTTTLLSAGPRLAEAPTWAWIAGGGVILLVLAALAERSEQPILPRPGQSDESVVGEFCRRFG